MKVSLTNKILMLFLVLFFSGSLFAQEYKLEYKYKKGKVYRYNEVMNSDMTQQMMGQEMKIENDSKFTVRMVVDNITPEGNLVLMISLDSAKVHSVLPTRGDTTFSMDNMIGKRKKVELSNLGEVLSREIVDTVEGMNEVVRSSDREAIQFPVLPEKEVKVGGDWNAVTVDTLKMMGGNMVNTTNYKYSVVGMEEKYGHNCLKIPFTGKMKTEGKGNMQGMELFMEGGGKLSGTLYFDPEAGVLVHSEANTDVEITVAAKGQQNMVIPITQSITSSRTLLPQ